MADDQPQQPPTSISGTLVIIFIIVIIIFLIFCKVMSFLDIAQQMNHSIDHIDGYMHGERPLIEYYHY